MLKDCLKVLSTALGETLNFSIGFIRKGANFIQTNHRGIQLLGDYRDILVLDFGQNFALKSLEKIVDGIDDDET